MSSSTPRKWDKNQKIAQFLGESTAGSQQLVENLLRQAQEEGDAGPRGRDWKWDISTSK